MCLKQELKHRSKNTNPKIKNLKITIFSIQQYHQIRKTQQNPSHLKGNQQTHLIFSNPANPTKSISFKNKPSKPSKPISFSQTQQNPSHLKANPANPFHLKGNPANPPKANPNSVAMLPANELFSDRKLVPLQLSSVKRERAHPPENRIAHPPENHRPIVNPLARLD